MKSLNTLLKEYILMRQSLGFKLQYIECALSHFICFLKKNKSRFITSDLALAWATHLGTATPINAVKRLSVIRSFAKYVACEDSRNQIPSPYLIPYPKTSRKKYYIYSNKDFLKLMKVTTNFNNDFIVHTYSSLIGLLIATGMRIGEAIALNQEDFNHHEGVITIVKDKRGESRRILLHSTTTKALKSYEEKRDMLFPKVKGSPFFVSTFGGRVDRSGASKYFNKMLIWANIYSATPKPRIHDIRHTFIIRTIERWYEEGKTVEPMLPHLSTYVGHVKPSSTYWYLTLTPKLMNCAANLLDRNMGVLP